MSAFAAVARELVGLVVDDGSLAGAALAAVIACALLVRLGLDPTLAATALAVAVLAVLAENVRRSARRIGRG